MKIAFLIASHTFIVILKMIVKSLEKSYMNVLNQTKKICNNIFPKKKKETEEEKKKRFEDFIETIAKEGNWAGDYEISVASNLFNVNINLLKRGINTYK